MASINISPALLVIIFLSFIILVLIGILIHFAAVRSNSGFSEIQQKLGNTCVSPNPVALTWPLASTVATPLSAVVHSLG